MDTFVQQNYSASQVNMKIHSTLIDDHLEQLLDIILNNVNLGPKEHQINMLTGLKNLIDNYI